MFRNATARLLSLIMLLGLSVRSAEPDRTIEQRLQSRVARSSLRSDSVSVKVTEGVAVVEGSVRNVQRKGLATRFARESGAIRVVNLLKVTDGKPQEPMKVVRVLP